MTLASASPQRTAILTQLGIAHEVSPADIDELTEGEPFEIAAINAQRKADALRTPGRLVLGADTVVTVDDRIYPKPETEEQARQWLAILSGREHEVLGGFYMAEGEGGRGAVVPTTVRFRKLDQGLIDWYVATGEWRERAGGYAIQGAGAALVAGIQGDYLNVVGLPITQILALYPELLVT